MEVEGKAAVVTGGASGIGRGICIALAEKGCRVAVADLEVGRAAAVVQEIAQQGGEATSIEVDVTNLASVESLADRAWSQFGSVDIVFNNAGVVGGDTVIDSQAADLQWLFSVNVLGVWHGCTVFGKRFRDQGSPAWIVNTGSEHSLGVAHIGQGFYTATKHAVLGLSDVLRRECPSYIGVSVLCPGVVNTDFWNAARNRPADLGGPADPNDIARQIVSQGMDPIEIGRRAIAGVQRESFLIVTHPHSRSFAEERWTEIQKAFAEQAPPTADQERYDVNRMLEEIFKDFIN